ncbi:unnamed protein product, partial [Urochloa humidicola]
PLPHPHLYAAASPVLGAPLPHASGLRPSMPPTCARSKLLARATHPCRQPPYARPAIHEPPRPSSTPRRRPMPAPNYHTAGMGHAGSGGSGAGAGWSCDAHASRDDD